MAICYPLSAYNWLQNEWRRMTLSGYFTPNSVFVPEVSDPEGSAFKDNCVKTSKHRPILSCKSFWQYKSFADIRRRFFQERRQTGVRSLKSTNLQLFHAISSEVSEITSALIANWRHTVLDFCRHQQGWRRMTLNARFNLKWALWTARLTYVYTCMLWLSELTNDHAWRDEHGIRALYEFSPAFTAQGVTNRQCC